MAEMPSPLRVTPRSQVRIRGGIRTRFVLENAAASGSALGIRPGEAQSKAHATDWARGVDRLLAGSTDP